jgi:hypothetical protein
VIIEGSKLPTIEVGLDNWIISDALVVREEGVVVIELSEHNPDGSF